MVTKSTSLQNTLNTELGNLISGIAMIVEYEQQGEARAAYGKQQLKRERNRALEMRQL